jgi:acetyl-CoA C-acetyltransferase
MTFAGGPLNNYVLQSTSRMGQLLRARPGSTGLVTSVSGLLTKQGFGVWTSALDASRQFQFVDVTDQIKAQVKTKKVLDNYEGPGVIAGYTVLHGGSERKRAVAIIDIDRERRTVAYSEDARVMAEMESAIESVGRGVSVGGAQFGLR